jgi:Fe-S cluster assembly ATP-binding protein
MLEIKNLKVDIDNKNILNNFNLKINENEIHVIMGPNGAGKSSLSRVIMRDEDFIASGSIEFLNNEILSLKTDEVARLGIFLSMQNPLYIEGISNADFLRTAIGIKEKSNINLFKFITEMEENVKKLDLNLSMVHEDINKGFSGGQKKKNEILQMKMLKPKLILLDEIDSGVDVDSLKKISKEINDYKKETKASILIITHYTNILKYIKPDFVHILKDKKIIKTGDYNLAKVIEEKGYEL